MLVCMSLPADLSGRSVLGGGAVQKQAATFFLVSYLRDSGSPNLLRSRLAADTRGPSACSGLRRPGDRVASKDRLKGACAAVPASPRSLGLVRRLAAKEPGQATPATPTCCGPGLRQTRGAIGVQWSSETRRPRCIQRPPEGRPSSSAGVSSVVGAGPWPGCERAGAGLDGDRNILGLPE